MNEHGTVRVELKTALDDAGPGEFEAVMSTAALDRHGEHIDARAFEPLPEHIPIDLDHAMSAEKTVASGRPYYDADGMLRFRGTFASTPLAQDVRTLAREGHLRTMSDAFGGAQRVVIDGVPHIVRAELLNAGIVGVPANREALITAAKSLQRSRPAGGDLDRIVAAADAALTAARSSILN